MGDSLPAEPAGRPGRAASGPVRPKERFLVFGQPKIEEEEIREVADSLRKAWLGTGPKAQRFEEAFRRYKAAPHAAAVSSCTAALHVSLLAAGIGPGHEVITSAFTFVATVNSIVHAGATPVLADVDSRTMNLDPVEVRRKITPRTKALLPVHFAGRPCDMDALLEVAREFGLTVIEDCAHAIETETRGRKAGTIGDFGCFSFYATKTVTTGEGGIVLAKRAADIERIKVLSLHGLSHDAWKRFSDQGYRHYTAVEIGFKYNMTDLQAAIGLHQLERVEANHARREAIWRTYGEAFSDLPLELPAPVEPGTRHAYHLYTILIDSAKAGIPRDAFLDGLTAHNIGAGVHYLAIPEHPCYRERFGWRPEDYPNAWRVGRSTVSLPLSAKLSDEDVDDVIEAVRRLLRSAGRGG